MLSKLSQHLALNLCPSLFSQLNMAAERSGRGKNLTCFSILWNGKGEIKSSYEYKSGRQRAQGTVGHLQLLHHEDGENSPSSFTPIPPLLWRANSAITPVIHPLHKLELPFQTCIFTISSLPTPHHDVPPQLVSLALVACAAATPKAEADPSYGYGYGRSYGGYGGYGLSYGGYGRTYGGYGGYRSYGYGKREAEASESRFTVP